MALQLFNTLIRKKEIFQPLKFSHVGIYICGPTVYDYTHIGHIRTYINSDILRRTLIFLGYKPFTVMNITDVGHLSGDRDMGEDKMEKAARKKKTDIWRIARFYTDYFFETMEKVNVLKADIICRATDHIKEMIALIKKLDQKGYTYQIDDGIYFDTSRLKDYGKLAGLDIEGLKKGARVEYNPQKKNPTDFALWKFSPKKGPKRQMEWSSPWGIGFPGWHIECSAMSMKYLGETFDIHCGGVDHIPVHHSNEIAQSETASGKQFVRYWFHSEHLLVERKKMSKSLRNFLTLNDLEKRGYQPLSLRYLFLNAHYRKKMNFTWQAIKRAQKSYLRLKRLLGQENKKELKINLKKLAQQFKNCLSDDLNTPQALACLWKLARSGNLLKEKQKLAAEFDKVLGLDLLILPKKEKISSEIKKLVAKREFLRKAKKWAEADKIRRKIEEKGYILEDTKKGTKISKKN